MESLYRKYRPQTFGDVVGQQHVVATLEHAVQEGRTSHAYLFCGPRGTGKTTMARLLAKALMCEQGPGHLPDGTCEQCELIAAGDHPDVLELDAASRTGVDNVREEIINRVSYAPVRGRYKVYIIDEVHMLTTQAFNALLKTLEEPPAHVLFVLCTTDPQRIPATILSRVQRFDFRPIGDDDIRQHLRDVCEQEGFTYEDAAIDLVVAHARGGMRDALSTLEQLSVFGDGVIGLDAAQDMLGAVSGAALNQVVASLAERDIAGLFAQIGALVESGRDLLQFTRELAARLRDVYVVAAVGANPAVVSSSVDVAVLAEEAAAFGPADRVAHALTVLGDASTQMSTAPNQRLVLEIAFTKLARPEADLTLESLSERVAVLESKLADLSSGGQAPAPASAASAVERPMAREAAPKEPVAPAPAQKPVAAPSPMTPAAQAPHQPVSPSPSASGQDATRGVRPVQAPSTQQGPVRPAPAPAPAQPAPTPAQPATAPTQPVPARPATAARGPQDMGTVQRAWRQVVSELLARLPARGSLLTNAVPLSDTGEKLTVGLPKGSNFALKMLDRPDIRAAVEGVVGEVFGPRTLVFKEGTETDLQLPAVARATRAQAAQGQVAAAQPQPAQTQAPQPQPFAPQASAAQPQPVPMSASQLQMTRPAPAPQGQPATAAQRAASQQSAPAPSAPVPEQSYAAPWEDRAVQAAPPAPQSQPQTAPSQQATPAPRQTQDYGAPWDEPVPYEEFGAYVGEDSAFDDGYGVGPAQPAPSPAPQSAPQVAPNPVPQAAPSQPRQASAAVPASAPAPRPAQAPVQTQATTPAPAQTPAAPSASSTVSAPEVPAVPAPSPAPASELDATPAESAFPLAPEELPPDLSAVLENAFEVFGSDLKVSRG